MAEQQSLERRLVLRWAMRTERVLWLGTIAAAVTITARVFGRGQTVKLWQLGEVRLTTVWVLFAVGTLVHAFVAYYFRDACHQLEASSVDQEEKEAAYADVVIDGGYYVGVAKRRLPEPGKRVAPMDPKDPSTIVAHVGAVVVLIAILPWWYEGGLHWPSGRHTFAIGLAGVAILVANWLIGSGWAIALSALGVSPSIPTTQDQTAVTATFAPESDSVTDPLALVSSVAGLSVTLVGAACGVVAALAGLIWAAWKWLLG